MQMPLQLVSADKQIATQFVAFFLRSFRLLNLVLTPSFIGCHHYYINYYKGRSRNCDASTFTVLVERKPTVTVQCKSTQSGI